MRCETGDCGPQCRGTTVGEKPTSLAEFALDAFDGMDFYDLSLVDGFNVPISITLLGGQKSGHGTRFDCGSPVCRTDINAICPPELRKVFGATVGCNSACDAFGNAEYCCTGEHSLPSTCPPSSYSTVFKKACPDAYSYAYDDESSTYTCRRGQYAVTFCPA